MALKPFYNKKYHLGVAPEDVKKAVVNGGALPSYSSADAGKTIVVAEDGTLTLGEAGGSDEVDELLARTIGPSYYNSTVSLIGERAFAGCSALVDIELPNVTDLGREAFRGAVQQEMIIETVSVPNCETIGQSCFLGCLSLRSIFSPKLKEIGDTAFGTCGILSVNFPILNRLGPSAFQTCKSLHTVIFGNLSMSSGEFFSAYQSTIQPFRYCDKLMSVYLFYPSVNSSYGKISSLAFGSTPMLDSSYTGSFGSIFVPASLVSEYQALSGWSVVADRIASIPEDWTP